VSFRSTTTAGCRPGPAGSTPRRAREPGAGRLGTRDRRVGEGSEAGWELGRARHAGWPRSAAPGRGRAGWPRRLPRRASHGPPRRLPRHGREPRYGPLLRARRGRAGRPRRPPRARHGRAGRPRARRGQVGRALHAVSGRHGRTRGARGWGRATPSELRPHTSKVVGRTGRAPVRARREHGEEGDGEEGEEVSAGGLGRGENERV
jgi:hypothetical protein